MTGGHRRLSAWAVLSMVLAVGMCPIVTILALPAALMALRETGPSAKAGRRLAITAIVVSCIVTPLTTWGAFWWNAHVRVPLFDGPIAAIQAGQAGDVERFRTDLARAGDNASAGAFLDGLTRQLGVLRSLRPAEAADAPPSAPGAGSWTIWVPYEAMFDGHAALLHARFVVGDDRGWITSFDAIEVAMPDGGTSSWPPGVDRPGVAGPGVGSQ